MDLSDLFAEENYRFHMSLRRGVADEFFGRTAAHEPIVAERRRWLEKAPRTYCDLLNDGATLLNECLDLARDWQSIMAGEHERIAGLDSPQARCRQLAEIWEPDFLLLQPNTTGQFQLLGGCVCFPSSWSLAEKIGHPLAFIHGPVPGLNEQLGKSIDGFLTKLAPGQAWLRHNWGLSRSRELNQHPSRGLPRLDDSVRLDEVWLRVEHQALVALPRSNGILFGIRIAIHPLEEVKMQPEIAGNLSRSLLTMPEPVTAYKGLSQSRERLIALLK